MADGHRLYYRINLTAHRLRVLADQRLLDVAGVTAAQAGVLLIVGDAAEPVRQRDLARLLRQRESAVTAMVERLIAAGLLARARPPGDGRTWLLRLTAGGEAALALVRGELEAFNARAFRGVPAAERAVVARALDRVLDNLSDDA